MSRLLVSVHDVAASTLEASRHWVRELDSRGVPATLLVVAGPWNGTGLAASGREVGAFLRKRVRCGDEVALHGWTHRADIRGSPLRQVSGAVIARGAAEFWGLDGSEAHRRLSRSRQVVEQLGVPVAGFTPPGWVAANSTFRAARTLGFRYVATSRGITLLPEGRRLDIPGLCQRPGSMWAGVGIQVVRQVTRYRIRSAQAVRIGVHPHDLDHPDLVAASLAVIDDALAAGLEPTTYLGHLANERSFV